MSEPVKKTIQARSQKRKRDRQFELLSKRARNWYAELPAPPNFCMFYLQKGVIISEGPPHMTEFFKDPSVLARFKEVSLNRTVTFQNTECDERDDEDDKIVLPYADHEKYSWDAMVFLLPALLAKVGIKGKHAYTDANRPTWWPAHVRFCSPNSSSAASKRLNVTEMRSVMCSFLVNCRSLYKIVDSDQTGNDNDVRTDTGNDNDVGTDTGNDNDVGADTDNDHDVRTDTGNDNDVRTDTGNDNDVGTDTDNDHDVRTDTGNDNDVRTDTGNDNDVGTDTDNDVGTDTDNDHDVRTDTGNDNDVRTDTGNDNDVGTDTGNDNDVRTDTDNDNDVGTDTDNDNNIRTDTGNDETFNHIVLRYVQDLLLKQQKESNFLITCCEGIPISLHSLYSIRDKLEDEIIDSYIQILLRRNESKIEYLKCALISMMLSLKHQHVVSDCEIVSEECIGVFNVGRKHWILIIIKFKTQQFIVMDPLGENNMTMKDVFAAWINHLKIKNVSNIEMWNLETLPHAKQQDSTSCGVFCLMFAEKYINSSIVPCQDLVMPYRHNILRTILENPDVTSVLKLCRLCMREEPPRKKVKQIDWVGCEKCGMYWCHFSCMRLSQTLSNFASSKWLCRFCS